MDSDQFEMRLSMLLSTLRALLSEIPTNLRAVSLTLKENFVMLRAFFHGDYSEDDMEEISCVETEASCDSWNLDWDFECLRCDEPNPFPAKGDMFAFVRKEDLFPPKKEAWPHLIPYLRAHKTDLPFPFPERRAHILLSIQYALLGTVGKNIRCINLEWTDKTITVYVIIDGEIKDTDRQSMNLIKEEMRYDFPDDEITIEGIRFDYPERPPTKGTIMVYERFCELPSRIEQRA